MAVAARLPVVSELAVPREPGDIHGPADVVQIVAFAEVQESVAAVFQAILQRATAPLQRRSSVGGTGGGTPTFTVTVSVVEPPGPAQSNVYSCVAARFPVDCEPEMPAQPPGETEQLVVFALDQEMVAAVLKGIVHESNPLHLISAVGEAAVTFTVTEPLAEPDGPEQFTVYTAVAVRLPVDCEPEVPVQFGGMTVQKFAFVLDHEIAAEELYAMEQEPAVPLQKMFTVGGGEAATT